MLQLHLSDQQFYGLLTHSGRVTHLCVAYLTIIASDNGLSPSRRQAIIWTNARILLIRPVETNFSEILIEIHTFSFKKMHLMMSSAKRRSFCLGLNVLRCRMYNDIDMHAYSKGILSSFNPLRRLDMTSFVVTWQLLDYQPGFLIAVYLINPRLQWLQSTISGSRFVMCRSFIIFYN